MSRVAIVVLAATLLAACASTSPAPAFRDTAVLVSSRMPHRIAWDQAGSDDHAVARQVGALLSRELTADTSVQVALLHNEHLRATFEDLSIAQADLVQAGLLRNPSLGASVVFPVAGNALTGGALSVTQDFLSVFTLAARRRVASADLEATKLRVADVVLRLAYDVQAAFYGLQGAQQIKSMRRAILDAEDAALELARRQREAGNTSDLDLATQETLYEQAHTDLLRSEADVTLAREALARLLGVWGADAAFRVGDKLPELPTSEAPLDHLESLAMARRLDVASTHQRSQALSHALAMATNFRFLESSAAAASFERSPEGFSVAGPGASLELPIFDQKQAAIARLEAQLRASLARERGLAVDARAEVRAARSRVLSARALVERYAKVGVPLRERVVALAHEQYGAMLLGAYQLLHAKQAEVTAYRELIEALRDYWTARAELERATGGSLPAHESVGVRIPEVRP
jgi:cobalt-zinc-cadmium efflux system outer membrane protein